MAIDTFASRIRSLQFELLIVGALAAVSLGCSGDDDNTDSPDTVPEPSGTAALAGTVSRTAAIAAGNDGVGTLLVGAFDQCGHGQMLIGAAAVPDADLSGAGTRIPFTIAKLPRAVVHLAAFLDDDRNFDPKAPLPGPGDLVYGTNSGDGVLDCIAADLRGGDRSDIAIELNLVED